MNQPVSTLNLPLNTINKLENLGFYHCKDVKDNLESIHSKINLPNLSSRPKPKTALDLYQEETTWEPITTSLSELDTILSQQILPGTITELAGLPGTGKTQICLYLTAGVDGDAVFIHTNSNFNVERLKEIGSNSVVDKVLCIEAPDPVDLLASIQFLENWLSDHGNIKLLIIDDIWWPLKQKDVNERSSLIYQVCQSCRILANLYNFVIVMTNNLTTRVTEGASYHTSALGDSFYHVINNRILLSKDGTLFTARSLKGATSTVLFKFPK